MNKYVLLYGILVGVLTGILVLVTAVLYAWDLLEYIAEYNLFLAWFSAIILVGLVIVMFVLGEEKWGL